jgi:hypothetical protein
VEADVERVERIGLTFNLQRSKVKGRFCSFSIQYQPSNFMKMLLMVLAIIPIVLLVLCMVTIQDKSIDPQELPGRVYGLICTTLLFSLWVLGIVAYHLAPQKSARK